MSKKYQLRINSSSSSKKKKSGKPKPRNIFLRMLLLSFIWGIGALIILMVFVVYSLPDIRNLKQEQQKPIIILLAKNGEEIGKFGNQYGVFIPFDKLPKSLVDAVISTEDRRFFSHMGVDPLGLFRALWVNWKAGRVVQGGSTITQQLAKVAFLSHDRTIKRKLQEFVLALYLESKYTKEEIFALYINRIYFGAGNYGIEAASRHYFNKSTSDLTLYESALLAGVIKAPSRYNPSNNSELALRRADQVLVNMVDNDKVSLEFLTTEDIEFKSFSEPRREKSEVPFFTQWIKDQLRDYIGTLEGGTFIVRTTLDAKLQEFTEQSLSSYLNSSKELEDLEGAVVVMSPEGAILSMVGGKSYKKSQFNRATQALRQPGSAFKLFVYLAALEAGYSPDSVWEDSPVNIGDWSPKNWNDEYIGDVSLKDALAKSINTVAVKVLKNVGIKNVENVARQLGITTPINNDLTTALGSSEVTLLELTGAYAHLANYGNLVWPYGVEKISNSKGEVIYQRYLANKTRALSPKTTAQMNDMLISTIKNGTAKKARIWQQSAGKTGTSQEARDAWFVGYTGNVVAGVWLGYDDNRPMKGISGGNAPAILWSDIAKRAEKEFSNKIIPVTEKAILDGPDAAEDSTWRRIINMFGRD